MEKKESKVVPYAIVGAVVGLVSFVLWNHHGYRKCIKRLKRDLARGIDLEGVDEYFT